MWIDIIRDPSNLIVLLPTLVILISAIIYYFGVRYGDTQATEYGIVSHYFFGVLFIISYILEPYLILLFVKYINDKYISYSPSIEINIFLVILGLFIEISLYFLFNYIAKNFRDGLKPGAKFDVCEEGNSWKWLKDKFSNLILTRPAPFIIIFIIYGFCIYDAPPEIILISLTLAFLTFTDIAFCVGFYCARYRENVLCLKNGRNIEGIILKYGSYVNILTKDGVYLINKDDISTIKTSKNSKELRNGYISTVRKKLTSIFQENVEENTEPT